MATFLVILSIAVLLVIDVVPGSDVTQYNCEIGWPLHLKEPEALGRHEFFGQLLPLVLLGLGSPLLLAAPRWGCLCLGAAAVLYVGKKVCRPATGPWAIFIRPSRKSRACPCSPPGPRGGRTHWGGPPLHIRHPGPNRLLQTLFL